MAQVDWAKDVAKAGRWIWHTQTPVAGRFDMALFYRELPVPAGTRLIRLFASADNRYKLYVDAGGGPRLVGRGPERGDLQHTSIDPYEIARDPSDRGPVRLWSAVRFIVGRPEAMIAEMHWTHPGFLLLAGFYDESGELIGTSGTDKEWLACSTTAIEPLMEEGHSWFLGATELHHAQDWPGDWLAAKGVEAGSARWRPAEEGNPPYPRGNSPFSCDHHFLVPRQLPQMEESPLAFAQGAPAGELTRAAAPAFPITVPPGGAVSLVFDAGEMVCAYPALSITGAGAQATLTYAEVLRDPAGIKEKSHALAAGLAVQGPHDRFEVGAGQSAEQVFETFHWRSFRFVRLDVQAGATGATVSALDMKTSWYPHQLKQTLVASGAHAGTVEAIMGVSWRTLRCCSFETYMDCPFYEQLQYIGDTRIQALATCLATGDYRLPRQAIMAFDRSRTYEGITHSRYPSNDMQLIPTFSLIHILMLDDYRAHTADQATVDGLLPGVETILAWFERYVDKRTGLLGRFPYWAFVDWVHGWADGTSPGDPSSPLNLHYLLALRAGARLCPGDMGKAYAARAADLARRIHRTFWDGRLGLLHDVPVGEDPGNDYLSQHAQALAAIAGVIEGDEALGAMKLAIAGSAGGKQLKSATLYYRFYLAEAIAKVGWGAGLWPLLEPFRDAIARGSTTWPESYEPCRSECHAWGSWPMYFFGRYVLGVNPPDAAGHVAITPIHCPPLDKVEGTVMTRQGPVHVRVEWAEGKATIRRG